MTRQELERLARLGVPSRLEELRKEQESLIKFAEGTPARASRTMSKAARAAVSVRMKKYWAARRKAKGN